MNVLHQVLVVLRNFRRKRMRSFLAMRVNKPPRFDERSTIDRFRRESGLR